MKVTIEVSPAELVELMSIFGETPTKKETIYKGEQYSVDHLDSWNLIDIYRGVKMYNVGIRGYGICMGGFIDRKTFDTIGIVHKYIDNELDNVQG